VYLSYDGHPGYDYPIAGGDKKAPPVPILAVADGTVIRANMGKKTLGEIWIDHGNGYCTMYNHLSEAFVDTGDNKDVIKGQQIGMSGSTGAKYHHLHFSVFICPATNPLRYIDPYGWDPRPGADVFVDPHTETSVCLWEVCE
jgi:murein DD-endopeptidase MepM/ murein hydrolase activator NlpD